MSPTTINTTTAITSTTTNPPSLWQQWSLDAAHAFHDLYGTWMLGDDAGQSAKLVVVVNGTGSACVAASSAPATGANEDSSASLSLFNKKSDNNTRLHHRIQSLASNFNNIVQNNNHNNSKQHVPTPNNKHHTTLSSLGVTFCEINGRAYVQTVQQKSHAQQAGVCPRDCVQYAAVLASDWKDPLGEDFEEIQKHALEREENGQRISYKELKTLLQTAMYNDSNNSNSTAITSSMNNHDLTVETTTSATLGCFARPSTRSSSVPTTIQVGNINSLSLLGRGNTSARSASRSIASTQSSLPQSPSPTGAKLLSDANGGNARPIVFVFRRTKQRPTTPVSLPIWPNYRLDDECDVACQILKSLATSPSTVTFADAEEVAIPTQQLRHQPQQQQQQQQQELQLQEQLQQEQSPQTSKCPVAHSTASVLSEASNRSNGNSNRDNDDIDYNHETVEAATIRGMIQNAVGLAFLRSNKVVLGVSIHAGSGIVVARLPDGTWSAPSAIGIAGVGLGFQLGVEVAHSILILQTKEALEHFQRGGSFTVGANVGAAVGGIGREAIGAASLSGLFCDGATVDDAQLISNSMMVKEDEYHFDDVETSDNPFLPGGVGGAAANGTASVGVAPLVAYAKSQGLYVGLSLEGSRIHGRDDVNARTYQFNTRKPVTAQDLLTGKVAPPPEADKLYEALHQVEFTHELQSLPRPPKEFWGRKSWYASSSSPSFFSDDSKPVVDDPAKQLQRQQVRAFEQKFRDFLFGGVYVWRVRGRKRERRTLWLCVPEGSASLQLGFVSKLSQTAVVIDPNHRTGSSEHGDDRRSVASEEVTLDSALLVDNQSVLMSTNQAVRTQVELSRKNTVALTDVVCMDQSVPSDLILEFPEESRRVISLQTKYSQLSFIAKSDQEAQVLMSGIRILLELETNRLGVRGGVGKDGESPRHAVTAAAANKRGAGSKKYKKNGVYSGYSSSDVEDNSNDDMSAISIGDMPEGWKSWGRVPGRNFLRGQAAANDHGYPQYVHGQLLVRDIAKNVHLPLPLPLCRVLLLDSSSPVISQWEKDRGDLEFEKTPWTFPPATPRERDQFQSEHQLIASGSMCGAHRTISYKRPRHGQLVRLFETQIVDSDDSEKLSFQIHERMPRRGFSIKVKILLRSYNNECDATVLGEIRPVGKNMSNPEAVHKAFILVIEELRERYGPEGNGLLSGFLNAVNTFKEDDLPPPMNGTFHKIHEEKKEHESSSGGGRGGGSSSSFGLSSCISQDNYNIGDGKTIKLEDMLKANANLLLSDVSEPKSLQDRTPSPMDAKKYRESYRKPKPVFMPSDTFDSPSTEPVMIEVKPLPKIRLSLMPSPREEDEFDLDESVDRDSRQSNGSDSHNISIGELGSRSKRSKKSTSWGKRKPRKSVV